jgi:hypothetical protein
VFVHLNVGSVPLTARVPADQLHGLNALTRGAAFTAHLQMPACHLFDSATGARL